MATRRALVQKVEEAERELERCETMLDMALRKVERSKVALDKAVEALDKYDRNLEASKISKAPKSPRGPQSPRKPQSSRASSELQISSDGGEINIPPRLKKYFPKVESIRTWIGAIKTYSESYYNASRLTYMKENYEDILKVQISLDEGYWIVSHKENNNYEAKPSNGKSLYIGEIDIDHDPDSLEELVKSSKWGLKEDQENGIGLLRLTWWALKKAEQQQEKELRTYLPLEKVPKSGDIFEKAFEFVGI